MHVAELAAYPVVTEFKVLWGDQDSFGHVNNLVYLRWAETARVEYLRRIGLSAGWPPSGIGPIVAAISCQYRRPLNYPDTVVVGTRVTQIGNSSFRMVHAVWSREAQAMAAEVDSTMVAFDYSAGKPVRVPDAVRDAIGELEALTGDSQKTS